MKFTWTRENFMVTLVSLSVAPFQGRTRWSYELQDNGEVIFAGTDFETFSNGTTPAIASLLGFLTLQPGDTDADYFEGYSDRQIAWRDSDRCDKLKMIYFELDAEAYRG